MKKVLRLRSQGEGHKTNTVRALWGKSDRKYLAMADRI